MIFKNQIRAIKRFERSIVPIIRKTVVENEQLLLDYNKRQLQDLGEYADGAIIIPEYTPYTISLKKKEGKEFRHVTLKDKGGFQKSFKLGVTMKDFRVDATDKKKDSLEDKYNEGNHSILGIQPTFLNEFVNIRVLPNLLKQGRKILVGK